MLRTFHKTTEESGRSMVEMLGVLAIIGVLSVGGIAGYSMAMSKFKITKTIDQVQTIITNLRTLYASQRTYSALNASTAYNMGILTDETYDGTNGLNPFGGQINFGTGSRGGAANRSFTIEYTELTAEACVKLATADWGADASSGLLSITTNGASEAKFEWGGANALPPDLVVVANSCAGEGDGANNVSSVKWEFR